MDNKIIEEIVKCAHYLYDRNMSIAKSGNISIIDKSREYVYITASGTDFKTLKYDDIIKLNLSDQSYSSIDDKVPSMETSLHTSVYDKRSDVNSIVHVHSPYATGFAFSKRELCRLEGFGKITSEYIPRVSYYTPGSKQLATHASEALENEDAILLEDHGVICVGKDISEATLLSEYIEDIAKTQYITHTLNL
ncbi:MAG: class II aldolase/adducin family protein [Methanosphaera sp.]|nr:class II aldolase/adducin family protein [Methanosphaera sp.]